MVDTWGVEVLDIWSVGVLDIWSVGRGVTTRIFPRSIAEEAIVINMQSD
jgi:hypothetical protein